jgi:hypothetical protein
MPRETVGLKIDIDSRSVATAARRSDDLARSSGKVGDALGGMARAAAAVGVAATAAVAGVVALTLRIAEQSDEIAKHSSRLGISIESYQELSHAMELSGGSIGEASAAIRRLSGNMLDASQGVSTAVDAFADLGIETTTAAGGMRSVDAVLADIADEFEAMPDGVEKTARAMELFGRSGATLIPLLNQGADGIAAMREEAHDLGLVISDETARAAEALNDDLTRLRGIATGFARDVATELIPRLRIWVGRFEDLARGSRDLSESIGSLAGDALDGFIATLQTVASLTIGVTQSFLWWKMAYEAISLSANDSGERVDQFGNSIRNSAQETQHQIEALEQLQNTIDNLDFSSTLAEAGGMRGAEAVTERMRTLLGIHTDIANLDPDPLLPSTTEVEGVIVVIDKYAAAIKDADAAMAVHVATVQDGMREIFTQYNLGQEEIRRSEEALAADKSFDQLMQMKVDSMADASARIAEEAKGLEGQFSQLGKLGETALGGLTKGLTDLSMAAVWEKDGDALKSFGLALGKMLVQLGTMAVVYAGVAALGAVFPALQPLVGPAAAAPALAAAGAGAIAVGAMLGAAIPRGGGGAGGGGGGGGERTVETSRTTVYNLTLGAGMSQRGMNRALLEQVNTAVGQGV